MKSLGQRKIKSTDVSNFSSYVLGFGAEKNVLDATPQTRLLPFVSRHYRNEETRPS